MPEWKPSEIREWILAMLYPLYMKDSDLKITFNDAPSDQPEPPIADTIREAKLLAAMGLIDAFAGHQHGISARLTPKGRLEIETQAQQKQHGHGQIGFHTEEP